METHFTQLDVLLDRDEAAEYLHICKTTLDRLGLPKIKIRRRVLFKRASLDKWIEENTQSAGGQS